MSSNCLKIILKIVFYKIPKSTEDVDMLWSSFRAGDGSIIGTLKVLAKENGNYYDDDQSWVYFDDILKEIPINTYNQEHYLNNNKYIQLDDADMVYFIKILIFKIRSTTSPFFYGEWKHTRYLNNEATAKISAFH